LKRRSQRTALVAGLLAAALACRREGAEPKSAGATTTTSSAAIADLSYVGAAACAECHRRETALWRASDHALAMQEPTDATVLGDFRDRSVTVHGGTSTFLKRAGRFVVRTDGPDGRPAEFDVAYVFGVRPLQQYLIRFPGGRLQALGLAWDTRPKPEGGQRWFHLYPRERVAAGDALHWTSPQQNWNFMCAECHSTNLVRHYDAASDTFATSWSEIDVACEACHGPGSRHVARARAAHGGTGLAVPMPRFATTDWAFDGIHPTAIRTTPPPSDAEIDTCGRCHSRRGWSWEEMVPGRPLADTHRVALLDPDLYFDDGQIREEVYEYGSFLQSPMRRRGVVCTDCHDPHSGKTRAEGNALCGRCHLPSHFDAPAHHHHRAGSAGARCVSCHMPERTYMVVDPRRDHSLRVPRPDLSVALGTPNACNGCHSDRGAAWAAETVARWFPQGRSGGPHFGRALHAARAGTPGAAAGLLAVLRDAGEADIVRATALQALPHRDRTPQGAAQEPAIARAIAAAGADPSPLVRRAAADWIEPLPPAARARLGLPLLADPVRTVRLAAAAALAGVPEEIAGAGAPALARAIEEYRRSLASSADRAEIHFNLGNLERALGREQEAETAYRQALALDPTFVPAAVNLADLLDASGRRDEAETILRQALARNRGNADLEHALGLARVRASDLKGALPHLAAAHRLRPDEARYAYVYAVALHDAGDAAAGMRILESAAARHPADADTLEALVAYSRERGDDDAARRWGARLAPAAAE
jgi:predicted CXXCH cytochrome family protein